MRVRHAMKRPRLKLRPEAGRFAFPHGGPPHAFREHRSGTRQAKAAVEEGIVPGGGVALLRASGTLESSIGQPGTRLLSRGRMRNKTLSSAVTVILVYAMWLVAAAAASPDVRTF